MRTALGRINLWRRHFVLSCLSISQSLVYLVLEMLAHLKRKNVSFYYKRVRAYYVKLTYVGFFFLFFVMNLSLMYVS